MDRQPLVVGLAGPAGSGKTTVANALAPIGQVFNGDDEKIAWTHLYYAIPIYRMASSRQKIQGTNATSRQAYEIHDALRELFATRLEYDELVDLVYEILEIPCEPDGIKPRHFLQQVGTEICRAKDPEVFVKWMKYKIAAEVRNFEYGEDMDMGIVISDIRFLNECRLVAEQPRGMLIRLNVTPGVAALRIANRDNTPHRPELAKHISEHSLHNIPRDWITATIDTNDMSIKEQVAAVKEVIFPNSNKKFLTALKGLI